MDGRTEVDGACAENVRKFFERFRNRKKGVIKFTCLPRFSLSFKKLTRKLPQEVAKILDYHQYER